jgi:hypothetical protein
VCVVLCWPRFISPIFNVASPKLIFSSSSIVIKELAGSFPQDFVFFFPFFLINRTLSLEIKKTLSVCADVLPPLYTRLASLPSIRLAIFIVFEEEDPNPNILPPGEMLPMVNNTCYFFRTRG